MIDNLNFINSDMSNNIKLHFSDFERQRSQFLALKQYSYSFLKSLGLLIYTHLSYLEGFEFKVLVVWTFVQIFTNT